MVLDNYPLAYSLPPLTIVLLCWSCLAKLQPWLPLTLGLPCVCAAWCGWRKHLPCWLVSHSWHWPSLGPAIVMHWPVHSFFCSPVRLFSLLKPPSSPYATFKEIEALRRELLEVSSSLPAGICSRTHLSFLSLWLISSAAHQIPCPLAYSGTFFLPPSSSPQSVIAPFLLACKHAALPSQR